MRSSDDALRSVKKHLAVQLGQSLAPLCAARRFRLPSDSILDQARDFNNGRGAYAVWTGLDETDTPAEAVLETVADAAGLLMAPAVQRGRQRWFFTPPLKRRHTDGSVQDATTSEDTFSPSLVAGTIEVQEGPGGRPQWELLLGMPRFAFDLAVLSPDDLPYRIRPFEGDPFVAASAAGIPIGDSFVGGDVIAAAPDWDVRFFHDRGEIVDYPVAVVKAAGPTVPSSPHSAWSDLTQALALYLYPSPPAGSDTEYGAAQVAAERVRDLLLSAFDTRADRPMRIPLYDYDGIDYAQASSQREPYDYLKVVDFSVEVLPEPGDPHLIAVVADIRVSWSIKFEKGRGTHIVDRVLIDDRVR